MNLIVTYWGGETPEREFDILINDKVFTRQKLYQNKPGEFFEVVYPLSNELTKGKETITVKFKGVPTNWTGAIYNSRITRRIQ